MEVLKSLKRSVHFLGFDENGNKPTVQAYLFLGIQIAIALNIVYFLVDRWSSMDDRVIALKAITFLANYIGYMTSLICCWDEFSSVLNIMSKMNFKVPYKVTGRRADLLGSQERALRNLDRYWWKMIVTYVVFFNAVPAVIVATKFFIYSGSFQKIINETLSTPFPLHYPAFIKKFEKAEPLLNISVFVLGYLIHSTCMTFVCMCGYLVYVMSFCALTGVEYEVRLLSLSLSEMDDLILGPYGRDYDNVSRHDALRSFSKYFVRHHQDTYRRFNIVNSGIRWIAGTTCANASLYVCLSIYTIVQKDQLFLKIQEVMFLSVSACIFYLFDMCGEKIKTADENLRDAFYECSWTDKPKWFKTLLLVAITRSNMAREVKPFGFFTLNLNSFSVTMNAAYSYYNILYNFKSK